MIIKQGRLYAENPGEAALELRKRYGDGRLTLKRVFPGWNWFEFTIEIAEEEDMDTNTEESIPGRKARSYSEVDISAMGVPTTQAVEAANELEEHAPPRLWELHEYLDALIRLITAYPALDTTRIEDVCDEIERELGLFPGEE